MNSTTSTKQTLMTTNTTRRATSTTLLLALLLAATASAFAQGAPTVTKVEPPNWWAGHSINPVRVLIRGSNLTGAHVQPIGAGISANRVRVNDAGTYLFADVTIAPQARPGVRKLRLTTAHGVTEAQFEITPALPRAVRF